MTAVTVAYQTEITTVSGMKLYHLTTVSDTNTLTVPFSTITHVFVSCNVVTTPASLSYTWTGSTITFEVSSGTPDIDVMVWGR